MIRRLTLWGPVVLYMAGIFYLSSQPDLPMPPGLGDKPTHSIAYGGLGVLTVRAVAGGLTQPIGAVRALAGGLLATAYGATDEIHQMFVPGRFADWNDLAADAAGAAIGAAACWLWGIIREFRARPRDGSRHGL